MAANTLGYNQEFPIYNADGTLFNNLVLKKAVVESIVMSLGDKITGDVYFVDNTLNVTMQEYIEYNGVRYMLVSPPTIVREGMVADNSELHGMTKYSFVFYHPMCQLGNFPFSDVAVTNDETRYLSESRNFYWIGTPTEYAAKLNANLANTVWMVEISSSFPQDKLAKTSEVLDFNNATIADACQKFYETWGVPFIIDAVSETEESYLHGKRFKVILGYPSNEIYADAIAESNHTPFVFRMGQGVGLKNNSRTPRNNKIITRLSGYGSESNIPYGYPQIRWYGTAGQSFTYGDHAGVYNNVTIDGVHFDKIVSYPIYKGILGGEYVELIKHPFTRTHLMPSVYRSTLFNKISFLDENGDANENYNPDITLVDYYDAVYSESYPYPNEINLQAPSYESHEFEEDKPELGESRIVNVTPLNDDLTPASSWDDSIDDEGNYKQSYFQIVLPQLSFDIYACASITEEMKINMRSGACLGCTFNVQVDWEDYKANFYDSDGNFAPNGEQRNLTKYPKSNQESIALVLQKDNTTFGTVLPNIYQHPSGESSEGANDGDAFVILGISLPESYITSAESKLDADMKSYMLENNVHYFDYPLKFDEYFLAKNENILNQIKPSTIVNFDYAGQTQALYVKQLTVKYGSNKLPQYDITLTDDIEVVLNQIGRVAGDVNRLAAQLAVLHQNYGRNVWEELDKKLSKTRDDVASGQITLLRGLKVGQYRSRFLGSGAAVDPTGNAEFESIYSRSFISTPEFRFNRIAVTDGEQWCTNGYGTIESVVEGEDENGNPVTDGGLITLHLEENDYASVAAGDICRGIYNDIANQYQTADMDDDASSAAGSSAQEGDGMGFSAKAGFFTSYFSIERIVKNNKGECQFIYKLRSPSTPHPCAFMKFAQYGSFTNADRRASSYATSIGHYYEMVLEGVRTWQIESANVVYRKGYLGDMVVELADGTTRTLTGYGLYAQNNVYFGSAVIQLDPKTLEMLEDELSMYDVNCSEHVDMIVVDDTGNVIGGIYTETTEGGVTTREYRIQSAITVRKKGSLLTEALPTAEAGLGTYKINFTPVGCTAMIENSTIYITGIDHVKDGVAGSGDDSNFDYDAMRAVDSCRVDLTIDCEGKTTMQKSIPIAIKHDSQPYVGADISNPFSGVSWNTKTQQYIGLPIVFDFKMWHNDEGLDIVSTNDVSVTPSITGMTLAKSIVTNANGQKVARVTISALPASLSLVTELDVTCSAVYSGVRYERTLKHTINKTTDTNVYSIIPSVDEVMVNKNTGALSTNSVDISVVCDSSDDKHYTVAYADFSTHNIVAYYKKFYTNGTSDANETAYTNTAVSVDSSVAKVVFYLYGLTNNTVDRTKLHDMEDIPVIANGQDGKGIEYIFIIKDNWDGTEAGKPTIYDDSSSPAYQNDNHCPYTDAQHTDKWTDEPTGVASNARFEFYAQRKKINGVWQPFGDVKLWNRYVVDGVTPYMIDLSNEQSMVACNENGGVVGSYEPSNLMLFYGQSYAFTDFAIVITPINITCNGNSSAFTLTAEQKAAAQTAGYYTLTPSSFADNADSATITVTATKGNIALSAVYKINKAYAGKNGVIYSIQPNLDTIRKNKNGTLVDDTLTIQVKKTVGATSSILTTAQQLSDEGLTLKYENASTVNPQTITNAVSIATSTFVGSGGTWGKIMIVKDNVIVDSERINVVTDGQDGIGIAGTNIYYTASDSTPSTPSGAPSLNTSWVDNGNNLIKDTNATKHLYESTCTTYTNGTYSWSTPVDDGLIRDMASTSEQFAISDSGTTAPTTGWDTSVAPTAGKWIWSRTVLTFKDGSTATINTQCVGYCGSNGDDGNYYIKQYAVGNSRTTPPETGWSSGTATPTSSNPYVWERSCMYNPNTGASGSWSYTCLTGEDGNDGEHAAIAYVEPASLSIQCDSDGSVSTGISKFLEFSLYVGTHTATITSITNGTCPTGVSLTNTSYDTRNIQVGTTATAIGIAAGVEFTVYGTYDNKNYTAKCTLGLVGVKKGDSITGDTGPMYYPAGIHNSGNSYTVTSYLVPVVCSNNTYYYAKKSVPQNIAITNTEYWGAFSNFAAAFVQVLFANYAQLGAFIVNGNFFISQKGTVNGVDSSDYTDSDFVPYLKMNAFTGEIFAKRGTIGGFEIGDDYIGIANSTSGVFDGCRIYKDGLIIVGNTTENYAFRSSGGVEMIGRGKGITLNEQSGSSANHNSWINLTGWVKLNVVDRHQEGGSAEAISGLAANELYLDGYGFVRYRVNNETTPLTEVNPFGEIHVKTNMYNDGYRRINISRGNCTLPAGVPIGTVFYVKGTGSTVVKTESSSDGIEQWDSNTNAGSSVGIQSHSVQFVKTSSNLWTMFLGV